ncbi:MAG: STAS domain-containing protein [Chloroflexi bacterium]|nr:STAS domain-containing protein [Chloroflexota bacterium]MBU1750525.1 STAS domain-containing protein [Chloroflexota bacterium]MBU1878453.1 STAS domain-containing protein [Chloroflexota bacterium]
MLEPIRQWFAAPVFADEEKTRVAGLLNIILIVILLSVLAFVVLALFTSPVSLPSLVVEGALILAGLGLLFLMRRGYVQLGAFLLSLALWGIVSIGIWSSGGLRGTGLCSYFGIIIIASLILGRRGGLLFGGLSVAAATAILLGETWTTAPPIPDYVTPFYAWIEFVVTAGAVTGLLYLATRGQEQTLARAQHNEQALIESNQELQTVRASLEDRVAERTRELEQMLKAQGDLVDTQQRLLETIREMSTPVVPVMAGVIVLPLVGTIDSQRAREVVESLLAGIEMYKARVALMDITGVPVVDTAVAHLLLQAATAARMLGTQVVLVGIRPEVAQTIVNLHIDLSNITTRADLQEGVAYAQRVVGSTHARAGEAARDRIRERAAGSLDRLAG